MSKFKCDPPQKDCQWWSCSICHTCATHCQGKDKHYGILLDRKLKWWEEVKAAGGETVLYEKGNRVTAY